MPNEIDAPQITDNFIRKWAISIKPEMSFCAKNREEFFVWKEQLVKKIRTLLRVHSFSGRMAFKFFEIYLKGEQWGNNEAI